MGFSILFGTKCLWQLNMSALTVRAIVVLTLVFLSKQVNAQPNTATSKKDNCHTGPKKCVNGGRCEDIGDAKTGAIWFCRCQGHTLGKYCEIVNPCYQMVGGTLQKNEDRCSKRGECSMLPALYERPTRKEIRISSIELTESDVSYKCDCPYEFTGKDCETPFDSLDSSLTTRNPETSRTTQLQSTTQQRKCFGRNSPDGLKCGAGGRCVETSEGAVCKCQADYTGDKCDILHCPNCKGDRCGEDGKCDSGCKSGYSGASCETLVGSVQAVSMTLEGQFTPGLQDKSSQEYKNMSRAVETFTNQALKNEGRVESDSIAFSQGSVIAKYNVITNNAGDSPASIMSALRANANRFPLDAYRVDPDSITSRKVAVQFRKESNEDKDDSSSKTFTAIGLVFVAAACVILVSFFAYLQCRRKTRPPRNYKWNSSFPAGFARTYRSVSQPHF